MELTNSVAVVTGSASGLGAATARRLAAAGAKLVVVDRDGEKGEKVAAELSGEFVRADVSVAREVEAAFVRASEIGPVRVAVACAGVGWAARTLNRQGEPHDPGPFEKVIAVNLLGTFHLLRLGAAAIARTEPSADGQRGVIITTASVAAFDGQIGQLAYAASKGGVAAMTLPAARDLAPVGIRVCTIAPGLFDTPLLGILPEEARQALVANIVGPKRLGSPDEFADLAVHIAHNDYLNGEVIRLDGALRMPPK